LQSLYKAFIETDASLIEINPFITTKDDKLFALDAKITFDDNALFRHPTSRRCATPPKKIRLKWKPASTRSTTSSSTARLPAW
jgi:succinyl-CoA synthetase beta subunit